MSNVLFSREEALTGLTARRAHAVLFLIEGQTARLVAQTSQATEILPSEQTARDRDWAFLQAFAQGREPPLRPTIQDLEHHVSEWVYLVPDSPILRATIAHLLRDKYKFTPQTVPGIRSALGLDAEKVRSAYRHLYGESLDAIYRARLSPVARLAWKWAAVTGWLEALPPFWFAFAVSIPIGGTTLALPIAMADLGAIPGMVLLIVLGAVNILTVMALTEAVVRHGAIRFGNVFFGRLVHDYLGQAGSLLLSVILAAFSFGLLLVFYIGISSTLANATSIPSAAWCVLLLIVGLYFLSRGSLNTTIGSMMIITAINAGLLLIMAAIALTGWQRDYFLHVNVPFVAGRRFDPGILGLIFGVVLGIFFMHMSVVNFAPLLLRRDPGSKSILWGHSAGIVFTIVLASIWLLTVNGALAPEVLAAETGTVLAPLAARFGPSVRVLGSLFVVLSMGMGSIFFSLALFNLVGERLPAQPKRPVTDLPRSFDWRAAARQWGLDLLRTSPVITVCVIAMWLSITGGASFAGLLSFLGVATSTLAGGIFPILLLIAARRKGDRLSGVVYGFLGHPILVVGIYVLFLASLFVHGLLIWTGAAERAGALVVAVLTLIATVVMVRQGAFARRLVVELCDDQLEKKPASFSLVAGGQKAPAQVRLIYPDKEEHYQADYGPLPRFNLLQHAEFCWTSLQARELKVWVHRITPEGQSINVPVVVSANCDGRSPKRFDIGSSHGSDIIPLGRNPTGLSVQIEFPASSTTRDRGL